MADYEGTTDALERMERAQATQYGIEGLAAGGRYSGRNAAYTSGRRLMAKGEEARLALAHILGSVESGVSIEALEKALATIKVHLGDAA